MMLADQNNTCPHCGGDLRRHSAPSEQEVAVGKRIISETAGEHGYPPSALTGRVRTASLVHARGVAIRRIRAETKLPLKTIGFLFGGRDHSTILHHIQQGEARQGTAA